MESAYWDKFTKTGKIEDYLRYCAEDLLRTEECSRESVSHSDRYCAVSDPDRGIR